MSTCIMITEYPNIHMVWECGQMDAKLLWNIVYQGSGSLGEVKVNNAEQVPFGNIFDYIGALQAQLQNCSVSRLGMMQRVHDSTEPERKEFSSYIYSQPFDKSIFRKHLDGNLKTVSYEKVDLPNTKCTVEESPSSIKAVANEANVKERPKLQRRKSSSLKDLNKCDKQMQSNILTCVQDSQKLLRRYHSFAGPRSASSYGTHVDTSDGLLTTTLCSTEL